MKEGSRVGAVHEQPLQSAMDKKTKGMSFANKVSIFRIVSVPFFVTTILYYQPAKDYLRFLALGIFFLGVISDALDGFLARIMQQKTKAGAILDPLADKVMLSCAFIFIYLKDNLPGMNIPLWLVIIVLSRDLIILLGSAVIYVIKDELILTPSKWGKYTTFFQMLTIIAVLLKFPDLKIIAAITAAFTVLSGIDYLRKGLKVLF